MEHMCKKCMIGLEKVVNKGRVEDTPFPSRLFYEYAAAEKQEVLDLCEEIKPRRTLEVGCGPGRLIEVVRAEDVEEIVGIDANKSIFNHATKRFKGDNRVRIIYSLVKGRLPFQDDYFDLIINAMNIVGWQSNEIGWLSEMLRCSSTVYFTVYKKGFEQERQGIYLARGHKDIKQHANGVLINDCELGSSLSRSYTREELKGLCRRLPVKHEINDLSTLAYSCVLKKS